MPGILSKISGFRKKEGKEEKKTQTSTCNCEGCRFSTELNKKITDEYLYDLSNALSVFPSSIKDINPDEKFEEAKRYEKEGQIRQALEHYNKAAIAGFYQQSRNNEQQWAELERFIEEHPEYSKFYGRAVKAYKELRTREDIRKIMIDIYQEFITVAAEAKKK